MPVGDWQYESDIPVPGWAHHSTHAAPGQIEVVAPGARNWEYESDIPVPGSLHQTDPAGYVATGTEFDPFATAAADDPLEMVSDDAFMADSSEQPSIDTAGGMPSASERALTWQQWNATRQGARRLRGLGELGFTQLPNQRMVSPGGQMTAQERQQYGRQPLNEFRRTQGQLPSINTIASPGTY